MQQSKHIESNFYHYFLGLLLLFCFLAIQKNLYMMIPFCSDFFFEDGNTINQYYQEQTRFLSLFSSDPSWYSRSSSIISFVSLTIIISILSLFVWILWVSSEFLEEIKLIDIVNWIFHSPNWVSLLERYS